LRTHIESLLKLQEIDLSIRDLNEKKTAAPVRVNLLTEKKNDIEQELDALNNNLQDAQRHKIDTEDELAIETEHLNKSQQKLMGIKTNREYQALQKEIEDIKVANKVREDEILKLVETIENLQQTIAQKRLAAEQIENELNAEQKILDSILAELDGQIQKLEADRNNCLPNIRKDLLARYNLLKDKRNGMVIATVNNPACTGCNINLPPQLFNELLKGNKLHTCPSCQRILYHPPIEKPSDAEQK
jgi:hypothetical protein